MKTKSKLTIVNRTTSFATAFLNVLEPVIKVLDQYHPAELGHELPSRKDGLLRIYINNLCRDTYQQIYGVKSENYNFAGVKDNWDRAQNAVAQLVSRYSNNPEDMDADPNCAKFYAWYEQASAKFEMLTSILGDLETIYQQITGEQWEYKAPGSAAPKTKISAADAAAKLKTMIAANQAKAATA